MLTTEQLYIPGLDVTQLQPAAGQQFRYRYRELCLITSSGGHIFLIRKHGSPASIPSSNFPTVRQFAFNS
jgi:hypothetical protein